MLEILNLKPEAFGLDISDLSLKIVKLKQRGKFYVSASFGEERIKPGIIKEGEVKDKERLAEIIKTAVRKVRGEKLKTKYVIASLPEEKSFLQVIQMPRISEEDLKSAVIYEAENYIPLPIQEVYLDSQIIPQVHSRSDKFDVLLAALPKKIVDPYLFSFKKAGLQPKALEVESLSIVRALIKNEVVNSPVLLIDLGETRTTFIVFAGQSLRFTSSIPVSSGSFNEIISKNLGVSLAEAERLKMKYGLEERVEFKIKDKETEVKRGQGKIFEALVPALVDLIQQIRRHLEYYQTHVGYEHLSFDGKGVTKILLCGGGANLKGLSELLALELRIPVEIANPWVNILPRGLKEAPGLSADKSLGYTTALGLALRGIGKEQYGQPRGKTRGNHPKSVSKEHD
jgi:type IV pilus assembly protein PilM